MFKVKRRLKNRLSKGRDSSRSPSSSQRHHGDSASDSSSYAGTSQGSTGTHFTPPQPRSIMKTDDMHPQYSTDLDQQTCSRGSRAGESETTNSVDAGSSRRSTKTKRVGFANVHIREFERIIGDNPSCSSGAPISIGWAHGDEKILRVQEHESKKNGRQRGQLNLVLTRQDREELLLEWGASFHDIIDAIRTNIKIKNQRRRTVNSIGTYDRWEEAMENASRKIKRTLLLKKSKKESKDFHVMPPKKASRKGSEEFSIACNHQMQLQGQMISEPPSRIGGEQQNDENKNAELEEIMNGNQSNNNPRRVMDEEDDRGEPEPIQMDYSQEHNKPGYAPLADVFYNPHNQQAPQFMMHPNGYAVDANGAIYYIVPNPTAFNICDGNYNMPYNPTDEGDMFDDNGDQYMMQNENYFPEEGSITNDSGPPVSTIELPDDMDDEEAFLLMEQLSVNTQLTTYSEYTFPEPEPEPTDDNFEHLPRDNSYWEVLSSGYDCPAIRRKLNPVVISEEGHYDLDGQWQDSFAMQPPPNSANIISSWE